MLQEYDRDFNLWVQQQVSALKSRQFAKLDYNNLIEEIEDMGRSEKLLCESYLERLIEHILKLQYWRAEYEYNHKHWKVEVSNFRKRIKRLLKRSPSLKVYLTEIYDEIYQDAIDSWQIEFDIPEHEQIPLDKILDNNFSPKN